MATETISIPMTWQGAVAALLMVYENGSPQGRKEARAEIMRMAALADQMVERIREGVLICETIPN